MSFVSLPLRGLLLSSAALATVASAQDAPAAGDIVVTGQRLANQRSIAAKRADIRVQDTVSADDVGTLPDYGLGEALTRVPGVTLIQNNQRGEAQFINIRGLNSDYSLIEVDGVPLSTTETTRRNLSLDVLPSALATSITVDKSLTADLDGNAIGGIVNLKTRSAFDVADHFASVSGQIARYDNQRNRSSSAPSGRAEATVSQRFGSDRQFGVVLDQLFPPRFLIARFRYRQLSLLWPGRGGIGREPRGADRDAGAGSPALAVLRQCAPADRLPRQARI